MTIFLTTHYMEEAAGADYVIVIDHGMIAAKGTPAELKEEYAQDQLRLWAQDQAALAAQIEEMGLEYQQQADVLTIAIASTLDALPIVERCRDHISGFEVLQGTMDDAFIGITGEEIRP